MAEKLLKYEKWLEKPLKFKFWQEKPLKLEFQREKPLKYESCREKPLKIIVQIEGMYKEAVEFKKINVTLDNLEKLYQKNRYN